VRLWYGIIKIDKRHLPKEANSKRRLLYYKLHILYINIEVFKVEHLIQSIEDSV
jgi:hypothetical protein